MTEVVDPAALIEAAQRAAAGSDFPAAERLLREAAALQESALGPDHEDVASTLNNLAFVCERTNNLADAERYYRRAHSIAVTSMGPRHPFVATSIKNLVDFCDTHDIPIWKPPGSPAGKIIVSEATANAESNNVAEYRQELVSVARRPMSRAIALAGVGLVVVVAVVFTLRSASSSPSDATAPAPTSPALARETSPAPLEPPAPLESPAPRAKTVTPQAVTVLTARLCKSLKRNGSPDWQCSSPGGALRPGTYSFYTRLLTSTSTTVEHRWYRGGRAHLVMRLRVTPNPSGGYRTYSSNTISAERAGDWKVELRAADGTVLHEERFVVR
jgi:hypothetical protein